MEVRKLILMNRKELQSLRQLYGNGQNNTVSAVGYGSLEYAREKK
jgi:hypothetical protein